MIHLLHRWRTVETIGRIHTQRCRHCPKTRIRIR